MRKILVLVTAVLAVGLLDGCAGMPTFGVASDRVEVVDYRKMQLIDDQAKRIGVTVIWMRAPTKLVDRATAGS